MCDNCKDVSGFPLEAAVLCDGFAIAFTDPANIPVGPGSVLPLTTLCISGMPMAALGLDVTVQTAVIMDLNGLAQLKGQIEYLIKKMDAATSAQFVHLYDQQERRVRDCLDG